MPTMRPEGSFPAPLTVATGLSRAGVRAIALSSPGSKITDDYLNDPKSGLNSVSRPRRVRWLDGVAR